MTNPPATRREARLAAEAASTAPIGAVAAAETEAPPAPAAVFVDPSGRRSRRARGVVVAVVGGVLIYLGFIAVAILGQPGVESPLMPVPPLPVGGPVHSPAAAATPSPSPTSAAGTLTPSDPATAPAGSTTTVRSRTSPVPVPVASPSPTPSPSASTPGRSGGAPGHTPKPKPPGKP